MPASQGHEVNPSLGRPCPIFEQRLSGHTDEPVRAGCDHRDKRHERMRLAEIELKSHRAGRGTDPSPDKKKLGCVGRDCCIELLIQWRSSPALRHLPDTSARRPPLARQNVAAALWVPPTNGERWAPAGKSIGWLAALHVACNVTR